MLKKPSAILVMIVLIVSMLPFTVLAAGNAAAVSLELSPAAVSAGGSVTASGKADADAWVSIKILDIAGSIVFYDAVKSDAVGQYSLTFKVPDGNPGTLTVVAGYGANVANKKLTVGKEPPVETVGGTTGSGSLTPAPVTSSSGAATVLPGAGGTVSLGGEAVLEIPAKALSGSAAAAVKVEKVSAAPAVSSGLKLLGNVYEFTVDGKQSYSFARNVTIKLSFDPEIVGAGETPAVYCYDESLACWVKIGGAVSGNTVIIEVDHFTKFAVLAAVEPEGQTLTDITAHWAESNIKELVALGAVNGYPDGSFQPDSKITRAEFAMVLVKALQLEAGEGMAFADAAAHWARDAIATASAYGIIKGYSDMQFGPDDPITREQMAAMITNAAKLQTGLQAPTFSDSAKVSDWAKAAVDAAAGAGIIKGYSDGSFGPQGLATRAEAVTVIVKAIK